MALTTTTEIKALKPRAQRYDVAVASEDKDGNAVPGLQIRVYPSASRSFQYRYQIEGAPRRMTIGPFPAVSLQMARARHLAAAKLVQQRIDPIDHDKEQRAAEKREQAKKAAEITIEKLVEEFISEEIRKKRKDPQQAERLLKREVVKRWEGRKASDMSRRDGVLLLRPIRNRAPVLAERVRALLIQLFSFAVDEGHLEQNPMDGLKRRTKEQPRERKLDADEIRSLWHALDERRSSQPGGTLKKGREDKRGSRDKPQLSRPLAIGLKLLLTTGQRRGELLKARWDELDLDGQTWTIPAEHSKNGKEHVVPLSSLALGLLKELKMEARDSAYLFPTAHSKRRGDAPMTDKALTRAAARNQCGLAHWTAHDLRRTAASHMNRIGIDAIVVEKVLNHTLPRMMQTYNRHDYESEKRDALDRWAAELRKILAGKSNVVAIPKRQRARA